MKITKVWMPGFINAMFTVVTPNTIWVNKERFNIEHLIGHEKKHREQFKRDGLIKYLMLKIIGRLFGWAIGNPYEEEAYAEQDRIEFNNITGG